MKQKQINIDFFISWKFSVFIKCLSAIVTSIVRNFSRVLHAAQPSASSINSTSKVSIPSLYQSKIVKYLPIKLYEDLIVSKFALLPTTLKKAKKKLFWLVPIWGHVYLTFFQIMFCNFYIDKQLNEIKVSTPKLDTISPSVGLLLPLNWNTTAAHEKRVKWKMCLPWLTEINCQIMTCSTHAFVRLFIARRYSLLT